MILVDYPNRRRLKVYGRAEARARPDDPGLAERLAAPGGRGVAERSILIRLTAFDWNWPQHITPRFTQPEIDDALRPVREHVAALEAENGALRARLAALEGRATPNGDRHGAA